MLLSLIAASSLVWVCRTSSTTYFAFDIGKDGLHTSDFEIHDDDEAITTYVHSGTWVFDELNPDFYKVVMSRGMYSASELQKVMDDFHKNSGEDIRLAYFEAIENGVALANVNIKIPFNTAISVNPTIEISYGEESNPLAMINGTIPTSKFVINFDSWHSNLDITEFALDLLQYKTDIIARSLLLPESAERAKLRDIFWNKNGESFFKTELVNNDL